MPDIGQYRGQLRTDPAAADDDHPGGFRSQLAQPAIVGQGAVVDDPIVRAAQAAGLTAGRQQQLAVAVRRSAVVSNLPALAVDIGGGAAQVQVDPEFVRLPHDLVFAVVLPQSPGKRRAVVGGERFSADEADGPVRVGVADATGGSVRGHPAADQQVVVVRHGSLTPEDIVSRQLSLPEHE